MSFILTEEKNQESFSKLRIFIFYFYFICKVLLKFLFHHCVAIANERSLNQEKLAAVMSRLCPRYYWYSFLHTP